VTTPKSLPARPSQDFLRKQAKKLVHEVAAGNAAEIARVRAQLPQAELPLSLRDAQLVLAREYGFAGWQDLVAEVLERLGKGLDWAAEQAGRAIHDNDLPRLKQLLAEYPALLSWGLEHGGLVGRAVHSYAIDAFDLERERMFTRRECAELLIDAGAVVVPWLVEDMLGSRTRGVLQLFAEKRLLPRTLRVAAALGDVSEVRACLDDTAERDAVNDAFMIACGFQRESIVGLLLERAIALSPDLGMQIDVSGGRSAFVAYMCKHRVRIPNGSGATPWQAFVRHRVMRTIDEHDLQEFTRLLRTEPSLIREVSLIEHAVSSNRTEFIERIFEIDPGLLQRRPAPDSQVLASAFTAGNGHLVPLLTRVWPLPDDLPHAAGAGDFENVKKWFDESGAPALGDLTRHFPGYTPRVGAGLHWGPPTVQRVLDIALAWSVRNNHFEIADFLLGHGADINTRWSSHEPASILHEMVFQENYEAMQFLIDRGIDMTITDYRWGGTAQGWALHAANNEEMARWLAEAERRRGK
jgi:hypothetical protein